MGGKLLRQKYSLSSLREIESVGGIESVSIKFCDIECADKKMQKNSNCFFIVEDFYLIEHQWKRPGIVVELAFRQPNTEIYDCPRYVGVADVLSIS